MRVAFVLSFIPNPRMNRRIELLKKDHRVFLIYWNRGVDETKLVHHDIENHEISISSSFGNPLNRISETKEFASTAFKKLCSISPHAIYVQGLDMLEIAMKYKKKDKAVQVFYEIADLNTLIIDKQKGLVKKLARSYLRFREKKLIKKVKALVITSEKFYEAYYNQLISKDKVVYVPNIPNLNCFQSFEKKLPAKFTVGFIGSVRYENQLTMLIDAAKVAGVHVFIAGYDHKGIIKDYCKDQEHVTYYGAYQYQEEIASLYGQVHLIYSVYDANMTNVSVALPNRLYEAIYCEVPLLASRGTYLGELVTSYHVGVSIDHTNMHELIDVLKNLSTSEKLYERYVASCVKHKSIVDLEPYNQKLLSYFD